MVNQNDHPSDEEIAAFLDGELAAADRAIVSRHLAECDDCRALLGSPAARGPVRSTTSRFRRFARLWPVAAGLAAAAVLAVNMSSRLRLTDDTDRLRGDTAQAIEAPALAVLSPADGATVRADTLVLRWASAGAGVTYDVSIVDAAGDAIWSTRVGTTDVSVPDETQERLRAGATYYWRADALLPDLRTASTGPQGFVPIAR